MFSLEKKLWRKDCMIYVDEIAIYPNAKQPFDSGSCHLFSDADNTELIEFAKKIRLNPSWLQHDSIFDHFDLTKGKRYQAIKAGAKSVTMKEMIELYRKKLQIISSSRKSGI